MAIPLFSPCGSILEGLSPHPIAQIAHGSGDAELLCNHVFRYYGLPEDILSDRGPQFTSRLWSAFFKALEINVSLTSGYHPQSMGKLRGDQELVRFLRYLLQY